MLYLFYRFPFIMSKNLKTISVCVDIDEYEELKTYTKSGLSVGFLIREAIHDFLKKTKKT